MTVLKEFSGVGPRSYYLRNANNGDGVVISAEKPASQDSGRESKVLLNIAETEKTRANDFTRGSGIPKVTIVTSDPVQVTVRDRKIRSLIEVEMMRNGFENHGAPPDHDKVQHGRWHWPKSG